MKAVAVGGIGAGTVLVLGLGLWTVVARRRAAMAGTGSRREPGRRPVPSAEGAGRAGAGVRAAADLVVTGSGTDGPAARTERAGPASAAGSDLRQCPEPDRETGQREQEHRNRHLRGRPRPSLRPPGAMPRNGLRLRWNPNVSSGV